MEEETLTSFDDNSCHKLYAMTFSHDHEAPLIPVITRTPVDWQNEERHSNVVMDCITDSARRTVHSNLYNMVESFSHPAFDRKFYDREKRAMVLRRSPTNYLEATEPLAMTLSRQLQDAHIYIKLLEKNLEALRETTRNTKVNKKRPGIDSNLLLGPRPTIACTSPPIP